MVLWNIWSFFDDVMYLISLYHIRRLNSLLGWKSLFKNNNKLWNKYWWIMVLSISTNATLVYGLNTSGKCQTKQVGNPSSNTTNINITQYIFKIDIYVVYILHSREFIMRIWAMTSGFEHRKTFYIARRDNVFKTRRFLFFQQI